MTIALVGLRRQVLLWKANPFADRMTMFRYRLSSLLLVVTYIAVCLAIGRTLPWVGFLSLVIGVPAAMRTMAAVRVARQRLRPLNTVRQRCEAFGESIWLIVQANLGGALIFSGLVGLLPGLSEGFFTQAWSRWPDAEIFIFPSLAWIAWVIFWLRLTWPRRY